MISVRSYLTVGTAAVVGAGAIALTPALPGQPLSPAALPAPAIAEIALTGFSLPATDIIGVLQTLGGLGGTIGGDLDILFARSADGGVSWSSAAPRTCSSAPW